LRVADENKLIILPNVSLILFFVFSIDKTPIFAILIMLSAESVELQSPKP